MTISMKRLALIAPLFLAAVVFHAAATEKPRVSRAVMASMEENLNDRCKKMWSDNPFVLLEGDARSVYLEGYGAVFSTAVNLVTAPTLNFRPQMTKPEIAEHRRKKLERLPQLKTEMKKALGDFAASLDPLPGDEQVVIAIMLTKYPWEDVTGFPSEIVLQGQKKKLLEAKSGGVEKLDSVIRVTEF